MCPTPDPRETYWQQRFSASARAAAAENEVNIYTAHGWQARQEAIARRFRRLFATGVLPAGARVADLGCGSGAYCRILAGLGCQTVGMDLCGDMLAYANGRGGGVAGWVCGNGAQAPFRNGVFDAVLSVGVLQHLTDEGPFLAECHRILRPGGVLVFMTLNRHTVLQAARRLLPFLRRAGIEPEAAEVSLRRYTAGELRRALARHLPGCEIRIDPVPVLPGPFRFLEAVLRGPGPLRLLARPFAVDLLVTARLPATAPSP